VLKVSFRFSGSGFHVLTFDCWKHNQAFEWQPESRGYQIRIQVQIKSPKSREQPQFNIQFTLSELLAAPPSSASFVMAQTWPDQTMQHGYGRAPSMWHTHTYIYTYSWFWSTGSECLTRSTWRVTAVGHAKWLPMNYESKSECESVFGASAGQGAPEMHSVWVSELEGSPDRRLSGAKRRFLATSAANKRGG